MGTLTLTVEPKLGSNIDDICFDAVGLANHIGVTVLVKVNGIVCIADPGDNPDAIVADWWSIDDLSGCAVAKDRSKK